jgi:hypothetical protein
MFIAVGGSIGYWQGNVNLLVDDIGALKPSIFIGVPRVFDRIYNRVTDQVHAACRSDLVSLLCILGCEFVTMPRVFDRIYNRVTDQVRLPLLSVQQTSCRDVLMDCVLGGESLFEALIRTA